MVFSGVVNLGFSFAAPRGDSAAKKVRRAQESRLDKDQLTALFTNMRILKFKSQLTIAFFAAVNHLNGPLRKQNFTLTGSKGQGL